MKTAHLGALEVGRLGLGAMTMAGVYTAEGDLDDSESIRTIHRALELGVTHIDTAEVYGPFHSEEIVGLAVKGRRGDVQHPWSVDRHRQPRVESRRQRVLSERRSGARHLPATPAAIAAAAAASPQRLRPLQLLRERDDRPFPRVQLLADLLPH